MARLEDIVKFLDSELKVADFEDGSNNGLQVENSGEVKKVCCGVSASVELFESAHEAGADMVVCHHGLSWGDSLKRITGTNYRRLNLLMKYDMALYACHLPLDAHARYGNNALLCKALGLRSLKKFGRYGAIDLGYAGSLPKPMRYTSFKRLVARVVGNDDLRTLDFGKKTVKTVGVISGGAAREIEEAGQKGLDVYVSGEPSLVAHDLAMEYGINAVFAGHHATEVFGVRALASLIKRRCKVKTEFVEQDVGL